MILTLVVAGLVGVVIVVAGLRELKFEHGFCVPPKGYAWCERCHSYAPIEHLHSTGGGE